MAKSQTVNTVFGYAVDQASLARAQSAIKTLKTEQKQLIDLFNTPTTGVGPAQLNSKLAANQAALRKTTAEAEALRKKLQEIDNTTVSPNIVMSTGGTVGTVGGEVVDQSARAKAIARAGQELRMLPSIQTGLGFGTDAIANVLRLTGALAQIAGGFTALLAIAAPVGIAIGAVALILGEQSRQEELRKKAMEEAKEAADAYIESLKEERRVREEVRGLIAGGDPREVQARIGAVERQRSDAEIERANLIARQQAIRQSLGEEATANVFGRLPATADQSLVEEAISLELDRLQQLNGGFGQNAERIRELNTELGNFDKQLTELRATALPGAQAIAALEKSIEDERELRELSRKSVESLTAQLDELSESYDDTADALKASEGALAQARSDGNNEAVTEILTYQELLRQRLLDTELTGNLVYDARELAEVRERETAAIKAQIAAIDAQIARTTQQNQLRRTGTTEQIDERLAALNDENKAILENLPALRAQAATNEDAAKKVADYEARLKVLNEEFGELSRLRPDVAARQFREESTKLLADLTADVAKIEASRDARIAQLEQDRTDKETAAYAERNDAILEIQRKTRDDEKDQAEKHQKALARIVAKGNAAMANAVAARDALAFFLAKQSKDEQIKEENDANKERLAEIKKRSDEEYRVTNKRLTDTLNAAKAAADKAIRLERSKADAEIATRRAQYTAEFNALVTVVNGHASAWNSITGYAQQAVAFIQRLTGQAATQLQRQVIQPTTVTLSGGTPLSRFQEYQRSQGIPGFAAGGYPPVGRPVLVGENGPELVTFGRQARVHSNADTRRMAAAGGGMTFAPVINGTSRQQIHREVTEKLDQYLTAAGW